MSKDIERVKHFVSNEVYQKIERKVIDLKEHGWIQMYDEINVKDTTLIDIEILDSFLFILVKLIFRYMDYVVDENDSVIRGNKKQKNLYNYQMTFIQGLSSSLDHCPSCGASLFDQQSVVCPYCKLTIINDSYGLVLAKKCMVDQKKL